MNEELITEVGQVNFDGNLNGYCLLIREPAYLLLDEKMPYDSANKEICIFEGEFKNGLFKNGF